jgi:hypothetical protein
MCFSRKSKDHYFYAKYPHLSSGFLVCVMLLSQGQNTQQGSGKKTEQKG